MSTRRKFLSLLAVPVRLSAHLYVSPADVDAVLEVAREVAARA